MSDQNPVLIVLTPEQRALVHRLSGQHIEAIELEPNDPSKSAHAIKLRWRLSTATGIPRQAWAEAEDADTPEGDSAK